ncbi:MAG TPA: M23 family metallopeptidase [Noviherbaspirillum sp.]|jgi:murein DD-endopeptidase MepM/ murein hydrolase activator NlpD|uniref:M23 family metallopeptidase n=1 Tax=Noviherbaspirillum sp. TaxID=1926288 RepID=UPI002DDDAFA9|nr:M23 family metallopeptidase [Noviherbaspirillum sp.]HEV2612282.1 M23 family metallopeptidase [Noviherbaspirillum sp.]
MVRAFQVTFYAVLWLALLGIALPLLDAVLYASRLASMPAPVKVGMPVMNVKPAVLRDTWHASRSGGRRHEGIDIFARRGTPVQATTEGILVRRGRNKLGGNVVWVLGPAGQRHYYAHLDSFAPLSEGQRIQPGTVLGYVGNTGNAINTPPHLHYGIYTRNGAINPFALLAPVPD